MFRPGMGTASPSISLSMPAMIFSKVLLPEPLTPSTPILAPGKNESVMFLRIWRFGGTILPTRFIVNTYWAMGFLSGDAVGRPHGRDHPAIVSVRRMPGTQAALHAECRRSRHARKALE